MTHHNWQEITPISPGGTIFSLATDSTRQLWLASRAGLFSQVDDGSWMPVAQGQPLAGLNAIFCVEKTLFAGGGQGQIVYSTDGGQQWYRGRVPETGEAVTTCFAAGPNFAKTGQILAGTDGAGIWRSTDGGRSWQAANFGLEDFSVIALATPPAWERREVAFAATEYGFYRSPNGGRAWKKSDTGLEGVSVQVITVSPNFVRDRTVLVGTENQGIFKSTNGGKTWQNWGPGLTDGPPPINGLWLHPEFAEKPDCVAGTGDGQIFYSADGGASWQQVAVAEAPVLCLGGTDQALYAGLHDQGLLRSVDGGQSWEPVTDLAARAITRLAGGAGRNLFAFGPQEGAWRSEDGGRSWIRLAEFSERMPLLTLVASPQEAATTASEPAYPACVLAATPEGLHYSSDDGQTWRPVLPEKEVVTICFSPRFSSDGRVWAGTGAGTLLTSVDGGLNWTSSPGPKPGLPLVALTPGLPSVKTEIILAAVTFAPSSQQMTLWRSTDGGSSWQQWQQVSANWPAAHLAMVDPDSERVLLCLDRRCWISTSAGWQGVLETGQPILRLAQRAGHQGIVALSNRQLLCSPDGLKWSRCDEGLAGQILFDLALTPAANGKQTALVLTTGGRLWSREL